jgi:hypothetical protein
MPRPERIVLLRSGRHLQVALSALRDAFPGSAVTVVATTGTRETVEAAGVAPEDCVMYEGRARFHPAGLCATGVAWTLWRRGYDRVAVLWVDPDGSDRSNVDRTALLLAPFGFTGITPDGRLYERRTVALLGRELRRAIVSVALSAGLALVGYGPAFVASAFRRKPAQ